MLGDGVELAGCFIENEEIGITQNGARDRQALLLAAGQPDAAVAKTCVPSLWQFAMKSEAAPEQLRDLTPDD